MSDVGDQKGRFYLPVGDAGDVPVRQSQIVTEHSVQLLLRLSKAFRQHNKAEVKGIFSRLTGNSNFSYHGSVQIAVI